MSRSQNRPAFRWRIPTVVHEAVRLAVPVGKGEERVPGCRLGRQDDVTGRRVLTNENLFGAETEVGRQAHRLRPPVMNTLAVCCINRLRRSYDIYCGIYHLEKASRNGTDRTGAAGPTSRRRRQHARVSLYGDDKAKSASTRCAPLKLCPCRGVRPKRRTS